MESYSAASLMASMREALQAIAPVLDRVGVHHRPAEATYDGWEDLEAQIFRSVIGEPAELAGAYPMARYGFSLESYAELSFLNLAGNGAHKLAFVRFQSEGESFDSVLGAQLQPTTFAVIGTTIVPFDKAHFELCASRRDGVQSFANLSY